MLLMFWTAKLKNFISFQRLIFSNKGFRIKYQDLIFYCGSLAFMTEISVISATFFDITINLQAFMASAAAGYQQSDNLWCSAVSSSASPSGFTSCFYKVKISMIKFYSGFKQRLSGSVVEHV